MKRIIAAGLVLLTLVFFAAASASNAGTRDDPLITLSFLTGEYASSLKTGVENTLGSAADRAVSRLGDIYRKHSGYRFAPGFLPVSLPNGGTVTLPTGSSFILLAGSAELSVDKGTVINIAAGTRAASGEWLKLNQRYFCAENTIAQIKVRAASAGQIDGYYMLSAGKYAPPHPVFKDVFEDDWFFGAVNYVFDNGLFKGTDVDIFSPNVTMSRAMLVTVLHRLDEPQGAAGGGTRGRQIFTDVPDGEWYTPAVIWADSNRIVEGYGDGTFRPDDPPSREQMALIIYRYALYKGRNMSAPGTAFDAFPDKGEVSGYASDAMRWAVSQGVINGSDGKLLPQNSATRAQVAQIIWNYCRTL